MWVNISDAGIAYLKSTLDRRECGEAEAIIKWIEDVEASAVRDDKIRSMVECDGDAVVSEGDSNGAYVMTWTWVPFEGTEFDKELGANDALLMEGT